MSAYAERPAFEAPQMPSAQELFAKVRDAMSLLVGRASVAPLDFEQNPGILLKKDNGGKDDGEEEEWQEDEGGFVGEPAEDQKFEPQPKDTNPKNDAYKPPPPGSTRPT